jgi:hypothetical protein
MMVLYGSVLTFGEANVFFSWDFVFFQVVRQSQEKHEVLMYLSWIQLSDILPAKPSTRWGPRLQNLHCREVSLRANAVSG